MVKTHLPNISVRAAGSAFRLPHIRRGKKKKNRKRENRTCSIGNTCTQTYTYTPYAKKARQ
ncbi:CPS_HP_G0006340.mRNA.1.CDS.1 [Saccharomyces cerevisiae]|nr:CPS_HP_G0029720.mRNA.1.CDS.1 [Saccharomyces cerevisiae]CAI5098939.1 CPS_HP_G0006340.mRNA.1.CDS.1 [Saccharomyces cerevisiae]CAI6522463.1 CPS_HP_G0029720.mRNA.1.CDS.1 [Saccharomyces cerevisiae]CAI6974255.1 CPS_HP_G0006340.mRNA.1.CDS.1 [Saccharomyces cerevisiae]CAI7283765.1 CPS_collapsed_G0017990.mRNA.1.CDS.1 [Saccharomyces cerevisiae]